MRRVYASITNRGARPHKEGWSRRSPGRCRELPAIVRGARPSAFAACATGTPVLAKQKIHERFQFFLPSVESSRMDESTGLVSRRVSRAWPPASKAGLPQICNGRFNIRPRSALLRIAPTITSNRERPGPPMLRSCASNNLQNICVTARARPAPHRSRSRETLFVTAKFAWTDFGRGSD